MYRRARAMDDVPKPRRAPFVRLREALMRQNARRSAIKSDIRRSRSAKTSELSKTVLTGTDMTKIPIVDSKPGDYETLCSSFFLKQPLLTEVL